MIKIGNNTFEVPAPGAMKSFALQQRILPVAGRVAGVFLRLLGAADSDTAKLMDMDVLKVLPQAMPYVGEIFAAMPDGELDTLTRTLLGQAKCDGIALFGNPAGDPFDALMAGRTTDTWKLLWYALEVWYPDFFTRGRMFIASAAKEKPSAASTT